MQARKLKAKNGSKAKTDAKGMKGSKEKDVIKKKDVKKKDVKKKDVIKKKEVKKKKISKEKKSSNNFEQKLAKEFSKKDIKKIAVECGFQKRKRGKIKAISFIIGFLLMISCKCNTYEEWSAQISRLINGKVSKQALEERMTPETAAMLKMVLEQKLKEYLKKNKVKLNEKFLSKFRSIFLEDSTTFSLPSELAKSFPGNTSKGKRKAQAKIHALYNFVINSFSYLDVHSFSNNDQSLASVSLDYLQKGDLLIRDLGFLVMEVLEEMIAREVYFISRKKYGIKVFDISTGKEINLMKELRKKHCFDKQVLVGKEKKILMRLVILPISPEDAERRRRKAKKDRDKRLNHSKEYYEMLGYSIFITNIPPDLCSAEEIYELYRLRWRIEIIFKCWKSHLHIEKRMPKKCNNPERIYCAIYLLLIYVLLFHSFLDDVSQTKDKYSKGKFVSILKLANYFIQNFQSLFFRGTTKKDRKFIKIQCLYEVRKDRTNTMEMYGKLVA
jgi:hypothetical protein